MFEEYFYKRSKSKLNLFFNSARSSLFFLIKNLTKFDARRDIIVTGFTCEAVSNAVLNAGCNIKYSDINDDYFSSSFEDIKRKISVNTLAIIVQHSFGVINGDILKIKEFAKKNNIFLIEDCAASLFSKKDDQYSGSFGDFSFYSFELSKTITCLWGGALCINSAFKNYEIVNEIKQSYKELDEQSSIKIFLDKVQLSLSLLLYNEKIYKVSKYFLAVFYKTKIFKPSSIAVEFKGVLPKKYISKMPIWKKNILDFQLRNELEIILSVKHNIEKFLIGLNEIPEFRVSQDVVSSNYLLRLPIIVSKRDLLAKALHDNGIEPGLWFTSPLSSERINLQAFHYLRMIALKVRIFVEKS